jgi:exodeoxyribonuclease-3
MGFDKKATALFGLDPDLAVIPECSQRDSASFSSAGYESLWFGTNSRKGLAVFCRKEWGIRALQEPEHSWIVPNEVKGPEPFALIAVWACKVGANAKDDYIGQVYQSLKAHPNWVRQGPVIVAGDFNSNLQWDEEALVGNHSDVVRMLEQYGLVSAYHTHFKESQGTESRPTKYLFRHMDKPYHVDYVFIPKVWSPRLLNVRVGNYTEWLRLSDHCPLVAEVQIT